MHPISAAADSAAWTFAGAAALAALFLVLRRNIRGKSAADYQQRIDAIRTGTDADSTVSYEDAVRRANRTALKWVAGLLLGLPTVTVTGYLFASSLAFADRTLMHALGILTAAAVVLLITFLSIREGALRRIRHDRKN